MEDQSASRNLIDASLRFPEVAEVETTLMDELAVREEIPLLQICVFARVVVAIEGSMCLRVSNRCEAHKDDNYWQKKATHNLPPIFSAGSFEFFFIEPPCGHGMSLL
jgi:hypothetical protein